MNTTLPRRSLMAFTALTSASLIAGCAAFKGKTAAQVSAMVLTTLDNAVKTVANAVPAMAKVSPTLFPIALQGKIAALAADAEGVIAGVSTAMTANAAASLMSQALGDLSAMLNALSVVPVIPPPFGTYLAAASVAVSVVSGYLASITGKAAAPMDKAMVFKARYGSDMDPASADLVLRLGAAGRFMGN